MASTTPVILCGGVGSRLWPLSRTQYPKQFLKLTNKHSLFQNTIKRFQSPFFNRPLCITNQAYLFTIKNQLLAIDANADIILEPESKNTAAAIATTLAYIQSQGLPTPNLLIVPSDQQIEDTAAFIKAIQLSLPLVNQEYIITYGITPDSPKTGYGYIETSNQITDHAYQVKRFVEKPSLSKSQQYIAQKKYLWNSGIFYFKPEVMQQEMQQWCPDILISAKQAVEQHTTVDGHILWGKPFGKIPKISIDYAVMEHTKKAAVFPIDVGWKDIGSYHSLAQSLPTDEAKNTHIGTVTSLNSENNLIKGNKRLIATLGLKNTIVIDTEDVLLIAEKDQSEKISELVEKVRSVDATLIDFHHRVHRVWGWYEVLIEGSTFKVKQLHVYPGRKLSLQKHKYRSEHWVVIQGTATVQCDAQHYELNINQSSFIPLGAKHQLSNQTEQDLKIIEVQNGTYLGEDDIIRFNSPPTSNDTTPSA